MNTPPTGFLLINKPCGITSHDVVDTLRRITGIRKIGHAGTLDPFAEGLLLVAIGREATKKLGLFLKQDKIYDSQLILGAVTDTYDITGKKTNVSDKKPTRAQIEEILKQFLGKQEQLPPMYSAKKVQGKKLYELARKGIEVERKPCHIEIFSLKIQDYHYPSLAITVYCSSGTYIRSLSHDIGEKLSTGAYLSKLKRVQIGSFHLRNAQELGNITSQNWQTFLF